MGQLLLYSASAGSGKTHNIAGQYILLLFAKNKAHRNILAVTFTNKACEEMKSRIVQEMYGITTADHNNERVQEIKNFTGLPESKIIEISKGIFKDILHDYSFFSVSTIDSFFQKIVKNFTRETGIQYNYEIELDKESIINKGVDDLISLCETDQELKNDIIALVEQNISESVKWDFRRKLNGFIKTVLESDFRTYQDDYRKFFDDKNRVKHLKKGLRTIEDKFFIEIDKYSSELQNILNTNGLKIDDFSRGKSSIISRLLVASEKIKSNNTDTLFNNLDNISKWLNKADIDKEPQHSATIRLMQVSNQLYDFYLSNIKDYNTSKIIKGQLNYAALIDKALQVIHQNLHESGKFLISEIPVFLSEIANQNSSSFIYEKTGSYYENYLIDEFQDTSRIQWDSFKPLLSESLSTGDEKQINIIVGDLKQSIYSWRGGDWRLLSTDVNLEFGHYTQEIALLNNWRSGETIVNFNNLFFREAAKILENHVKQETPPALHPLTGDLITESIYSEVKQDSQKDFQSIVQIDIIKEDKNSKEAIVQNLIKNIENLQDKNYEPGDMMILVRSHSEGSLIANEIIKHAQSENAKPGVKYDVISSEALYISSNKAVRLIISCLKYLADNNNELAFTEAAYSYYVDTKLKDQKEIIFNKAQYAEHLASKLETAKERYNYTLLHELTDTLILTLGLNKTVENIPFLNSLRDLIHDYSQNNTPEVNGFLEYWEENGEKQNLKIPDKQNAINIITVHKSKGLAAEIVFIPFCNWSLHKSNNTIWVSSNIQPYNTLPIWPANFDSRLAESHFATNYHLDKFRQTIEAFNMMYVAFTRAKVGLFISGEAKANKNSIINIFLNGIELITAIEGQTWKKSEDEIKISYIDGEITSKVHVPQETDYIEDYDIFIPDKQIKIKPFFEKDKHESSVSGDILEGIILHKIFENIVHFNDIDAALAKISNEGVISKDSVTSYKQKIENTINFNFIKSWFDGTYKVSNEMDIADVGGFIRRPDRIMENDNEIIIVDYKFGDTEQSKYVKQTARYANLLRKMGYQNIKTYIWFVLNNYLLDVDEKSLTTKKIELVNEEIN